MYASLDPIALQKGSYYGGTGPNQSVYLGVYFLCCLLTWAVVFTAFRTLKVVVKETELGVVVTVLDVPIYYKIKIFCF